MRYVERNPLRANLVETAQQWPWSSLRAWQVGTPLEYLHAGFVARPANWLEWVNQPQSQEEVEAIRQSIARGTPLGEERWAQESPKRLACNRRFVRVAGLAKGDIQLFPSAIEGSSAWLVRYGIVSPDQWRQGKVESPL